MSDPLTQEDLDTRRLRVCVEAWPDCHSGDYDPRCCRFPKSCSPHGYIEAVEAGNLTDAGLEPPLPDQVLPPHTELQVGLNEVGVYLADLDATTKRLSEVDDFDTALVLLADAAAMAAEAKRIAGSFHDRAWALRGEAYGDYHHPTLGVVSVRRTSSRPRWDHPTLAERVVEQHVRANEGEAPDPDEVARWLLDAAAFGYWRKGKLRELGIDPDGEDLYWSEPGNPSISFPSQSG